jgi:hypothetical protein
VPWIPAERCPTCGSYDIWRFPDGVFRCANGHDCSGWLPEEETELN